ncbi:MAG: hypothetical protein NPIRA02_42590 [Nitrospirales bacterium]|nr:MAG: hypothetical protein NPIRA02_42590 [Nitrospirales bacterium]
MTKESPTIKSIDALHTVIEELKTEGVDPVFIVAALAQVQVDMMEEFDVSINQA